MGTGDFPRVNRPGRKADHLAIRLQGTVPSQRDCIDNVIVYDIYFMCVGIT
jgi:hypothetical protein